MAASSLETGYRWTNITSDDKSGILYIIAFLAFTYSGLTFLTRCFIKWRIFGLDDGAMCLAQIASVVQFSLLLVSLSAGLGKTFELLHEDDYEHMASSQLGNQVALYVSLGFSKMATVLLTQRLFTRDMKKAWTSCTVVTACIVIWTILAVFLVSVGCSPESLAPKSASQTCPGIIARYQLLVITDAVTDIILVIVPAYLCWQLQMSVLVKLQVLAVFAFRLPLVALAGLFLRAWIRSLSIDNPGINRTPAILFQQCQLCYSLIASTIPCLKSFLRSFDTGSGVKAGFGSSNEYSSNGGRTACAARSQGESYKLSSINRSKYGTSQTKSRVDDDDGDFREYSRPWTSGRSSPSQVSREQNNKAGYDIHQEFDRESQGSRQELFIRKDTQWEVGSDVRLGSDTPGMLKLPP